MQRQTLGIIFAVAGLAFVVIGVLVGWVIVPKVIDSQVKKETQLKEGSFVYGKWLDLPIPITMSFYFFNVTNAAEMQGGFTGIKPKLKEVGPFTFTEKREKYNVERNDISDTIYYRQRITFEYDETNSDPIEKITIINVPLISVLNLLLIHVPRLAQLLMRFLADEDLFIEVSPIDLAVRGAEVNKGYLPIIFLAENVLRIKIPEEFKDGKFGLYLGRNGNDDGIFEVGTGISDHTKFNVIQSVDGNSSVTYWGGKYCNMVNGTDGTMFPPFIEKSTIIRAYAPEVCRSLHLEFQQEVTYAGIPGYRFALPEDFFENPRINEDNQCFCVPPPSPLNQSCEIGSAIRVHTCKQGAPILISKPHFLGADQSMFDAVEGLTPDPEKHESFIDIEPLSGFPLRVYKRAQFSMEVQNISLYNNTYDALPYILFPVGWASENAALDDELVDELKSRLVTPLKIANISKWAVIGVGCLLVIVSAVILIIARKSKEYV